MAPLAEFETYFRALWDHDPFPWQEMLAGRVAADRWPQALDLPTASGKTACLDIAVWALAMQADRPLAERTAPRRIWLVVDRRIVVDEAFERASRLAEKLAAAGSGPLKVVADRLRTLSGTDRPLAVARLRGGIFRDDGWARIPSQPAIITSTVDQLGSRLLFRGYGHSLLAAPIFAGLAAHDSLIFLDEAHCAVPFLQTLRAVERYRGAGWAEEPLATPFAFVVMSATPPTEIPREAVFPGDERDRALSHPELDRRLRTSKLAELVELRRKRSVGTDHSADGPLVTEAVARAVRSVQEGRRRVAVIVNRVRTAEAIASGLRTALAELGDVVLLTGRIRPLERDAEVDRWTPYLRANQPQEPGRPIVVVATQCLEVGADFSFEALITECASLDALRQRFGRLARLGAHEPAPAAILIRREDASAAKPDAVYGDALAQTWKWLCDQAQQTSEGRRVVDFGVEALEARVRELEDVFPLLAPTQQAPTLLPAYLDLLCQTAPPAHPEPDVSLYLHGRPARPEVSVVWRCDLTPDATAVWPETVALCPPVSGEMLQVPLWRLRAWLAEKAELDDSADVEGVGEGPDEPGGRIRPCLLWRGRDRSVVARNAGEIAPGDVVVVPASYEIGGLGHATRARAVGSESLDVWEPARAAAQQPPAVRLTRAALAPWLACPPVQELLARVETPAWNRAEIDDAIEAVRVYRPEAEDAPPAPPDWWRELLQKARGGRIEEHPAGGVVLFGRASALPRDVAEPDLFADDDELTSAAGAEVTLDRHTESVRRAALKLCERCLPQDLQSAFQLAALWHDAGKLDERFQVLLRHGDEVAVATATAPLAKSASVPIAPRRRQAIREASGLPENFRHEFLSLQLVERFGGLSPGEPLHDLVLHLVASHHGHARPLAPVWLDLAPPGVSGNVCGHRVELSGEQRAEMLPAHHIGSGIPERFWRLVRRYGWWGLAYIEAILRLADWYGSAFVVPSTANEERAA